MSEVALAPRFVYTGGSVYASPCHRATIASHQQYINEQCYLGGKTLPEDEGGKEMEGKKVTSDRE